MLLFSIQFILLSISVLISVAFVTLLERKILSLMGIRLGPNKVSFFGLFQPVGDAFKLANKEVNSLTNFASVFYYGGCILMFTCAITFWTILPCKPILDVKFSLLYFFIFLGLSSLNSILCGWSTYSKYSLIGTLRTVSQLISYELCLYMCFFFFLYFYSVFSLYHFNFYAMNFAIVPLFGCFFVWIPSMLAELNRTPYDFSEGESELVSGFNTEFGSGAFTLIFLSEYSNIIFFSILTSFLFFYSIYFFMFFPFLLFILWVRAVLPRFRYDKLMMLAWKFFLPLLTILLLYVMINS